MRKKTKLFIALYATTAVLASISVFIYIYDNLEHNFITVMEKNSLKYQNRVVKVNDILELEGKKSNFFLNIDDLPEEFKQSSEVDLLKYLAYDESKDIFHFDNIQNSNYDTTKLSSITGKGNLDFLNEENNVKALELYVLFYMNDDFEWINERLDSSFWVYYTSLNEMSSMRRRSGEFVTSDEFTYKEEMLEMPYVTYGRKENLKTREEVYWTAPYLDLAGTGMMITASYPVDYQGEYVGAISIDFISKALSGILDEQYTSFLVDKDGVVISTNIEDFDVNGELKTVDDLPIGIAFSDIKDIKRDEIVKVNGERILAHNIYGSPYVLYQVYTKRAYHIDATGVFLPLILIFIFFGITSLMLHKVRESEGELKVTLKSLEEKQVELDYISKNDPLTNIYNRRGLYSELKGIEVDGKLVGSSVILFDIDHFKLVNDTYGHDVGDEVLTELCVVIKKCISDNEIFARYGGEEFILISKGKNLLETSELAEKIRITVENHKFNKVESITLSLGVSNFRPKDTNDTWIANADAALYKAKNDGRNKVYYYESYEFIEYTNKNNI